MRVTAAVIYILYRLYSSEYSCCGYVQNGPPQRLGQNRPVTLPTLVYLHVRVHDCVSIHVHVRVHLPSLLTSSYSCAACAAKKQSYQVSIFSLASSRIVASCLSIEGRRSSCDVTPERHHTHRRNFCVLKAHCFCYYCRIHWFTIQIRERERVAF